MSWLLVFAASAAHSVQTPHPRQQARAAVRILRPGKASAEEWQRSPIGGHREIVIRDEQGRELRVRVVEYE